MLFKKDTLEKIKRGEVTLAFRKWKRPTVKKGGTLKTPVGLLGIDKIEEVTDISDREVLEAGYEYRSELEKEFAKSGGHSIYRIKFHLAGEDPRITLREDNNLTSEQIEEINLKLLRFDQSKRYPGWAHRVLKTIYDKPGKSASWISDNLQIEKDWLKPSIRKLKEMGLTISLGVGYRVSPRGRAYLETIRSEGK